MSRLELAQRDRIAPWTANAAEFKKNSAALGHEAEIVATLAEIVSRPATITPTMKSIAATQNRCSNRRWNYVPPFKATTTRPRTPPPVR